MLAIGKVSLPVSELLWCEGGELVPVAQCVEQGLFACSPEFRADVYLVSVGVKPLVLRLSSQAIYQVEHAPCHALQCSMLWWCAQALPSAVFYSAITAAAASTVGC